jgi:hypothetical protein
MWLKFLSMQECVTDVENRLPPRFSPYRSNLKTLDRSKKSGPRVTLQAFLKHARPMETSNLLSRITS